MFDRVIPSTLSPAGVSGAKAKLLHLFENVRQEAVAVKEAKQAIYDDKKLSQYGKDGALKEDRQTFREAIDGYREEMLALVNKREEEYRAHCIAEIKKRLQSSEHLNALTSALTMLKQEYMGELEVKAFIEAYQYDDMAIGMIADTLIKMKSPYVELTYSRITMKKQLQAFESIRRIIRNNVQVGLADKPTLYGEVDDPLLWFGGDYAALESELANDLIVLSADATLCNRVSVKAYEIHGENKSEDVIAQGRKQAQKAKAAAQDPAKQPKRQCNPGTVHPVGIKPGLGF